MTKILLIGDLNSIHFIKWVNSLSKNNLQIGIFSFSELKHEYFDNNPSIVLKSLDFKSANLRNSSLKKTKYLSALPSLSKFIKEFKPHILHAHYASSYGLLGALTGFSPYIISVWGSDVFDFPRKNCLFKQILKYSLGKADKILSTSKVMAIETNKYTNKNITITPFGVDVKTFIPKQKEKDSTRFVLGTVKALEKIYGIDILLNAFALVAKNHPQVELKIAGRGQELPKLKTQAKTLGISSKVEFIGQIDNHLIPDILNSFDIYLALSRVEESFGVAVIEASACGIPVIVSNMGGFPEVVKDKETGLLVENESVEQVVNAIQLLIKEETKRIEMGNNGRQRVLDLYNWEKNVAQMVAIYKEIIS